MFHTKEQQQQHIIIEKINMNTPFEIFYETIVKLHYDQFDKDDWEFIIFHLKANPFYTDENICIVLGLYDHCKCLFGL